MENPTLFSTITSIPILYVIIWIALIVVVMYLARKQFHRCMASMGRIIYNVMRLAAASVKLAEKRLVLRNRGNGRQQPFV